MALTKVPSNLDATVATTQSASDNSTNVATTAYVTTAIANLVDGAPSTMNTLDEIAAALNDDAALNTTLTNSIATKLPLAGGTMTGSLIIAKDDNTFTVQSTNAGQASVDIKNTEGHFRLITDAGTLSVYDQTDSSERFKIDTSGNLSVGTTDGQGGIAGSTTPGIALNAQFNFIGATRSGSTPAIFNRITSDGAIVSLRRDGSTFATIGSANSNNLAIDSTATDHTGLEFGNDILPRRNAAVVDNQTNLGTSSYRFANLYSSNIFASSVGIGTTSPAVALHIESDGTQASRALRVAYDSSYYFDIEQLGAGGVAYNAHNATNGGHRWENDGSEKMRLAYDGKLGINRTSPNGLLHMQSPSGTDSALYIQTSAATDDSVIHFGDNDASSVGSILYDHSTNSMQFEANGSEAVRIDNSGKVGIGTSSPSEKLHVSGNIKTSGTIYSGGALRGRSGDSSKLILNATSTTTELHSAGTTGIVFKDNGNNEKVRIDSSGDINIVNTGQASLNYTTDGSLDYARIQGGKYGSGVGDLRFFTYSGGLSEAMRIDRLGSVGIGTASPASNLHIETNTHANIRIQAGANSSASLRLRNDAHDWDVNCQTNDNFAIYSHTSSAERLVITTGGDVGVGTSTPFGATTNRRCLSINGTSSTSLNIGVGGSQKGYLYSDGNMTQLGTVGNIPLQFAPNDTYRAKIDTSGNLLIRTASTVYDGGQLQLTSPGDMYSMYVSNTGFASHGTMLAVERGGTSSYSFAQYYSGRRADNGGGDREFNFRGDGNAYADASWNASGADYAEYFEWADGNTDNNDRVGHSVSLVNNKIKIAESGETVIGVISGNPSVVGDTSWNKWQGKHMRDDYGRYIWEEYTEEDGKTVDDKGNKLTRRKLNPDYNSETAYINRENRKEWDAVGLMGKLRMKKGQQTGTNWIKMRDISDSVEEWLVR